MNLGRPWSSQLEVPETTLRDVPFPVELRLPGVRVASMAIGEQSAQIPFLISVNTSYLIIPAYRQFSSPTRC